MEKLPVSVIIPVRNEILNIEECLKSLDWADELFIIDSQSDDGTIEKAEELGAKVVQFHYDGGWPKKKNWAMKSLPLKNEWIMHVDADERVTPELRDEIEEAIKNPDINGYYIHWKFIFLGRWLKHCWSHGWMLRLLRKDFGEYEDLGMRKEGGWPVELHENIIVQGKTACLQGYLLHESHQDVKFWLHKHNDFSDWAATRYTQIRAEKLPGLRTLFSVSFAARRKFLKAVYLRLPLRPLWYFVYLYVFKKGFLDGRPGFYYCLLHSFYELTVIVKIYEQQLIEENQNNFQNLKAGDDDTGD